jgi:hypothetical protein
MTHSGFRAGVCGLSLLLCFVSCNKAPTSTPCTTTCITVAGHYDETGYAGTSGCPGGPMWSAFSDTVDVSEGTEPSSLQIGLGGLGVAMTGTLYEDLSASFDPVPFTDASGTVGVLSLAGQFSQGTHGVAFNGTYYFSTSSSTAASSRSCAAQGQTHWTAAE